MPPQIYYLLYLLPFSIPFFGIRYFLKWRKKRKQDREACLAKLQVPVVCKTCGGRLVVEKFSGQKTTWYVKPDGSMTRAYDFKKYDIPFLVRCLNSFGHDGRPEESHLTGFRLGAGLVLVEAEMLQEAFLRKDNFGGEISVI